MIVETKIDQALLDKARSDLANIADGFPKAVSRAINRTMTSARSEVVKAIAGVIRIPQNELRRRNVFAHPSSPDHLTAEIDIRGGNIPLGRFAPRPSAPNPRQQRRLPGSSFEFRKGQRQTIAGSFTARMASGHLGIFIRKGKKSLPITERKSNSVPEVASTMAAISQTVLDRQIGEKLRQRIEHEVDYLVRKGSA